MGELGFEVPGTAGNVPPDRLRPGASADAAVLLRVPVRHAAMAGVEGRVRDRIPVGSYSVRTPNRAHVAAGQYLYCTSPSTSPRATKPIVRLSRELFRLSPSTKHIPSGTFALG